MLAMLEGLLIQVAESRDIELIHEFILRVQEKFLVRNEYSNKKKLLPLERLLTLRDVLLVEALGDEDEIRVGRYTIVRTLTGGSYRMDQNLAFEALKTALSATDEEVKAMVYKHTVTKTKTTIS